MKVGRTVASSWPFAFLFSLHTRWRWCSSRYFNIRANFRGRSTVHFGLGGYVALAEECEERWLLRARRFRLPQHIRSTYKQSISIHTLAGTFRFALGFFSGIAVYKDIVVQLGSSTRTITCHRVISNGSLVAKKPKNKHPTSISRYKKAGARIWID